MNKRFVLFYRTIALLQAICFVLFFVLNRVTTSFLSENRILKDFDIFDLPLPYIFLAFLFCVVFLFNSIWGLMLAFKPESILNVGTGLRRTLAYSFIIEILLIPFLAFLSFQIIKDSFFPSKTVVGEVFDAFFNIKPNENLELSRKIEAVNHVIFCCSSLLFVIFTRRYYRMMLQRFNLQEGETE